MSSETAADKNGETTTEPTTTASLITVADAFPPIRSDWRPNGEGQALAQEVPWQELGLQRLSDLQKRGVVFCHKFFSPPSASIRAILNYYQIPQRRLVMDLPLKWRVSQSMYKKVPQVILLPEGIQINDSPAIVQTLYPVLTQRALADDVPSPDDAKQILGKIPLMLMWEFKKRDPTFGGKFARHLCSGGDGAIPVTKMVVSYVVSAKFPEERYAKAPSFVERLTWFVQQLGTSQFWGGRDTPGPLDLSLYGFFQCVMAMVQDKVNQNPNAKATEQSDWIPSLLKEAGAWEWFQAVHHAYTEVALEPVIPEYAKDQVSRTVYGWW